MKKRMMFLLLVAAFVALLTITVSAAKVVDSGEAAGLTWTLTDDGVLTISGEGEMRIAPWDSDAELLEAIKTVIIEAGVTSISDSAFFNCENLTNVSIPSTVSSIGINAFSNCVSLTQLALPEKLTSIADGAFCYCSNLARVNLPSGIKSIGATAFYYCSKLKSITIPEQATIIGDYAFCGCSSLKTVVIPGSVKTIGVEAFSNCGSLTSVNLHSGVTTIGENAFLNCGKLESVTIPDTVSSIGGWAFHNCTSLKSITIPSGLESIEEGTFNNCSSLTGITIPAHIKRIGHGAFGSCSSMTKINVDAGNTQFKSVQGVLFNKAGSQLICCPGGKTGSYAIPNGVIDIAKNAFNNCSNLTSITIPASVKSIGAYAFMNCDNLEEISIPDGVTSIATHTFYWCINMQQVRIPASVASIQSRAFDCCDQLTDVYYGGSAEQWEKVSIGEENEPLANATIHFAAKPVVIESSPVDVNAAAREKVTFSVKVSGDVGSYQWQYKTPGGSWRNTTLSGYNTDTLTFSADTNQNGYQYRCAVKDVQGERINSKAATLTVCGIQRQPLNVSTTAGSAAQFRIIAVGDGLTYQWQYKAPSGSWTNTTLSGNKTDTLKVGATCGRNGYKYRCVITDTYGHTVSSGSAKLTVLGIKIQPAAIRTVAGKDVTMWVSATGENLTYQWQYQKSDGTWANTTLSGAKTHRLSIPATIGRNGNVYRCVVKSGSLSVTSNGAKVTVFGIKTQPTNVTAAAGKTATMKVVATGTNLTYRWQYQTDAGTWKNTTLTGAKTATLSIPATKARNGNVYRCVVKSGTYTLTSSAAKLTVK